MTHLKEEARQDVAQGRAPYGADEAFAEFQPRFVEYCKRMGFSSPAHQHAHDEIAFGHRNLGFLFWAHRTYPLKARW